MLNSKNDSKQQCLRELFAQVTLFSEKEWAAAMELFSFREHHPKEHIFSAGDDIKDIYFLMDGIGRYYYIDKEGKERNKSLVRKGGAFASLKTTIKGMPSPFFAQAINLCSTAFIKYEDLVKLSIEYYGWGTFTRKSLEHLALKKEEREADLLLLTAKERYLKFLEEFETDVEEIPLRHIAMYLGITDVSLSRIRKEMGLT